MIKLILLILLFNETSFASDNLLFTQLKSSHYIENVIKKEIDRERNKQIPLTSTQLSDSKTIEARLNKISQFNTDISSKLFEEYQKSFLAEFSKEEIAYLKVFYGHSISTKIIDFNKNFLKSKKSQSIINTGIQTLKSDLTTKTNK